jgi:hypothetical protein
MKSDYSHKIPSLPYNRGERRRPEYFDGIERRLLAPERQHYPLLGIYIDFNSQKEAIRNGGNIIVSVTNNGNGTAYTPFVELFGWHIIIKENHIRLVSNRGGFLMLSVLYPHQTKTVQVPWTGDSRIMSFIGICYDPFLDPRPRVLPRPPSSQPLFHKKITGYYMQLRPPRFPYIPYAI